MLYFSIQLGIMMVIHREFTNQNGGINRKYPLVIFDSVVNFIIPFDELIFFHRGRYTTNTSIIEYNGWNICNHYGDLWNPKMGIIWAIFGVNVAKYSSTMFHIW